MSVQADLLETRQVLIQVKKYTLEFNEISVKLKTMHYFTTIEYIYSVYCLFKSFLI